MAITLYVTQTYLVDESAFLANEPKTALELSGAKLGQRRVAGARSDALDSVLAVEAVASRRSAQERKQIEERILVPGATSTYELSAVRLRSIVREALTIDRLTAIEQVDSRTEPFVGRLQIADGIQAPEGLLSVRLNLRFDERLPLPDVTTLALDDTNIFALEDGTIFDLTQ